MATTFEAVAEIISDTSDIPLDEISPEKNAFTDLGIDSLDFLDIAFAIDKNFGWADPRLKPDPLVFRTIAHVNAQPLLAVAK